MAGWPIEERGRMHLPRCVRWGFMRLRELLELHVHTFATNFVPTRDLWDMRGAARTGPLLSSSHTARGSLASRYNRTAAHKALARQQQKNRPPLGFRNSWPPAQVLVERAGIKSILVVSDNDCRVTACIPPGSVGTYVIVLLFSIYAFARIRCVMCVICLNCLQISFKFQIRGFLSIKSHDHFLAN